MSNPKGNGPLRGEERLPGQVSKEMEVVGALGSRGFLLAESCRSASSSTMSVDSVLGVRLPMSGDLLGDDVLSLVGKVDQVYCLFNNCSFRVFRVLLAWRQSKIKVASLLLQLRPIQTLQS